MLDDYAIKLAIALLLGLLIGIDRQLRHKPLGIKTSMVIAIGSCLVTIVSIESVAKFAVPGLTTMDPMRLAAQIVSGVGFIGAGVILRRNNDVISGLTTSAMIWGASALGIATGAGFYREALAAAFFIMLSVNVVPWAIRLIGPSKLKERDLSVHITVEDYQDVQEVVEGIRLIHKIKHTKIKGVEGGSQELHLILSLAGKGDPATKLYHEIKRMNRVHAVEVESI
jgi:putative Mg2+ transporter-C (MgtC) family protein